jgi:hypothetical protein
MGKFKDGSRAGRIGAPRKLNYSATCSECGKTFERTARKAQDDASRERKTGMKPRAWCSKDCKKAGWKKLYIRTENHRRQLSERLTDHNPMKNDLVRAKVRARLAAIGHRPRVRGGNGHGQTIPERLLGLALGIGPVVVPTGMARGTGYPTNYKLDLGYPDLKIGIEVDGASHSALERQEQDRKKEQFLASLGWTVLRFSNEDVTERLEECVQTVLSIISTLKG